jgi:hypothetical protein
MNKRNPFEKWLTKEDHLQHQVISWMKWQYPAVRFHHSPNEGKRSPFEQYKFKFLGSDSGFPDLFFPSIYLVMELKIKPNKPSDAQQAWLDHFNELPEWKAVVCYSFEEAAAVIASRVKEQLLIRQYVTGMNNE